MNLKIRILHLEDDAADAELIQAMLESSGINCEITRVETREGFAEALRDGIYDIILADYRLPTYDGISALQLVKENGLDIPFIFVSGAMGEDAAINALTQGSMDYVLKQNLSRLPQAVTRALHEAEIERERKKAAQHQLQLLSSSLDMVGETILLMGENDPRFLYVNESAATTLGYSREELTSGMGLFDIDPDWNPSMWEKFWAELTAHRRMQFESRHRTCDGRVFPVEVTANYFEFDGKVYNLAICRNITERKRAEQERQASLHFFESMDKVNRAIQRASNLEQMMSDTLDVVLSVFDCDRAFLMYPCDPDAETWMVPMERTKPECPGVLKLGLEIPMDEEAAETQRILLAADGPVKFGPGSEYPLPTTVSENFYFKSLMSMAIYPKVGKPWHLGLHQCSYARTWTADEERLFREIGRRISDALSALISHRGLQESEEKYRQIIDTANEGIWMLDPDAITTSVNAKMAKMLGYRIEDMIGRPVTDFMFEEDRFDHLERIENRHQGISERYERRFRRKDGKEVWVLVSGAPIFDDEHIYTGAFAMFTDITERKQAEEALKEHRDHLEELVKERTSQLEVTNEHLLQEIARVAELQMTIERQLEMLQQALVPPALSIADGYRAASLYLPAFPGESIGGDLYEIFKTESGKIGIMIGDVAGKGIEAAALAAAARSTLHSFAYDLSSASEAMYHANAVLESQSTAKGEFVTAFLAIIDPSTGAFSYSRAGHPPAAIQRASGEVEFLEEGDMPLGLFAGQDYQIYENHLDPGDKIILYTDGITEARHGEKLFELEGVRHALDTCGKGTSEEVTKCLLSEARDWAKGRLQDDIAILVVERSPDASI